MQNVVQSETPQPALDAPEATILSEKSSYGDEYILPNEKVFLLVLSIFMLLLLFFLSQQISYGARGVYEPQIVMHGPVKSFAESGGVPSHAYAGAQAATPNIQKTQLHHGVYTIPAEYARIAYTPPPVGSRLEGHGYRKMLVYLAQKEQITTEKDAREVLAQAGYILPPSITPIGQEDTADVGEHLNFARDVLSTVVRDEVESFLSKVKLVSKVGTYVVDQYADAEN